MAPVVAAAPAAGNLVNLAAQLTAANVAPAVIQTILQSQMGQPAAAPMSTPPGFNRQNIVAPLLSSAVGSSIPDLVAALRGQLPDSSSAPGSKAILSEDLLPRLIEQERARQRGQALWGDLLGLDPGPTAEEVEARIRSGRRTELEELGARDRARIALEGQIKAAIRQMEVGADLKRAELEVGGGIKKQELSSLGDIQRQRVQSGYSAAQGLLNTAIQNMTAPQNLAQSSVLQQLATQVP
jgi:hypothetical protein